MEKAAYQNYINIEIKFYCDLASVKKNKLRLFYEHFNELYYFKLMAGEGWSEWLVEMHSLTTRCRQKIQTGLLKNIEK